MKTAIRYPASDEVWHLHQVAIYLTAESWEVGVPEVTMLPGWSREDAVTAYVRVPGPNRKTHERPAPYDNGYLVEGIGSLRLYQRQPHMPVFPSSGLHRREMIAELYPGDFYRVLLWVANREQWLESRSFEDEMTIEICGEEPGDASDV